jgi:hypothetical protein
MTRPSCRMIPLRMHTISKLLSASAAAALFASTPVLNSALAQSMITTPVEQNRLDPSAPSELRLQIDPGSLGTPVTNPDAQSSNLNAPGETYNTIMEHSANGHRSRGRH